MGLGVWEARLDEDGVSFFFSFLFFLFLRHVSVLLNYPRYLELFLCIAGITRKGEKPGRQKKTNFEDTRNEPNGCCRTAVETVGPKRY